MRKPPALLALCPWRSGVDGRNDKSNKDWLATNVAAMSDGKDRHEDNLIIVAGPQAQCVLRSSRYDSISNSSKEICSPFSASASSANMLSTASCK